MPFSASPTRVAAARPLRPVRSTFVAPILPEPSFADVAEPGEPGEEQAEGDRAEQIADRERGERNTARPATSSSIPAYASFPGRPLPRPIDTRFCPADQGQAAPGLGGALRRRACSSSASADRACRAHRARRDRTATRSAGAPGRKPPGRQARGFPPAASTARAMSRGSDRRRHGRGAAPPRAGSRARSRRRRLRRRAGAWSRRPADCGRRRSRR